MKILRFFLRDRLALALALVSLVGLGLVAFMGASIGPYPVVGPLPVQNQAYTSMSGGTLAWTGTGTITTCLTGTGAVSQPCAQVFIQTKGTGSVLLGSGTTGTALALSLATTGTINGPFPANDCNQFYVSGPSTATIGYLYFK